VDTSLQALTRTINKLGEAFEAFKDTNDERIKALESGDEGKAADLGRKIGRIEIDLGKFTKLKSDIELELKSQKDRIEELEASRKLPGLTSPLDRTQEEYKGHFLSYLRASGPAHMMRKAEIAQKMNDIAKQARQQAEHEQKAVIIGNLSEGGYAVPEEIQREIERLELKYSPVRRLVRVRTVGTSDYKELVDEAGQEASWAGEETTRAETASGTIRQRPDDG
jgi:HK97 family phage major capsid protein